MNRPSRSLSVNPILGYENAVRRLRENEIKERRCPGDLLYSDLRSNPHWSLVEQIGPKSIRLKFENMDAGKSNDAVGSMERGWSRTVRVLGNNHASAPNRDVIAANAVYREG